MNWQLEKVKQLHQDKADIQIKDTESTKTDTVH